jgi:hypothetical protein
MGLAPNGPRTQSFRLLSANRFVHPDPSDSNALLVWPKTKGKRKQLHTRKITNLRIVSSVFLDMPELKKGCRQQFSANDSNSCDGGF